MYAHLKKHAGLPLFLIRCGYGANAAHTVLELWAAFGMNPKNEQGLVDQIDERLPITLVSGVPTITYTQKNIVHPLLIGAPPYSKISYPETYFVHIQGTAREIAIQRTRLIDWVVYGAEKMHTAHGHPQPRSSTRYHLFEANQLVARKRKLIDW